MRREQRLKWASALTGAGLLVQAATFLVLHPLAFVAFVAIGGPLIAAGMGLYLSILLPRRSKTYGPSHPI
jgi:hypothetical protein